MAESAKGYRGLAADSREVRPGFLFAALPGTQQDGRMFIADAVRRGATVILGTPDVADEAKRRNVRFIADANPRLRLAKLAAEFFGAQPRHVAAVTGTNGKTSVASFTRQIWAQLGKSAASLGTLGVDSPAGHVPLGHTTPDPVRLHAEIARLKEGGVDWLALEASSHGLDQYRLDGVTIEAAGFTNITRDHMDYHTSFANYLAAKLRLFDSLVAAGGLAVVNADSDRAAEFIAASTPRNLRLFTVGVRGGDLRIVRQDAHARGQDLVISHAGTEHNIKLPLAGLFQACNALVAAGFAIGLGDRAKDVLAALETLTGAPGRLQLVARTKDGAPIYVDYAHTPDAMETVLTALRPHVKGKLAVVFGCGGDRDRGKRPLMGEAAARLADCVIVTDDNPRTEDAATIRAEALAGCPGAREIGDRSDAIRAGVEALGPDDVLIIAGKGHEDYQIVGRVVHPFSDRAEAVAAARALGGEEAQ